VRATGSPTGAQVSRASDAVVAAARSFVPAIGDGPARAGEQVRRAPLVGGAAGPRGGINLYSKCGRR